MYVYICKLRSPLLMGVSLPFPTFHYLLYNRPPCTSALLTFDCSNNLNYLCSLQIRMHVIHVYISLYRSYNYVYVCQRSYCITSFECNYNNICDSLQICVHVTHVYFSLYRSYAATIPRSFTTHYNPYTQCIEILNTKEQILKLSHDIRQDMFTLTDALQKLK